MALPPAWAELEVAPVIRKTDRFGLSTGSPRTGAPSMSCLRTPSLARRIDRWYLPADKNPKARAATTISAWRQVRTDSFMLKSIERASHLYLEITNISSGFAGASRTQEPAGGIPPLRPGFRR